MSPKPKLSVNTYYLLKKANNIKTVCITTCFAHYCYGTVFISNRVCLPVWECLAHANHLDLVLNESCRLITGCLKPNNASNFHLLAGISPPEIRREAASKQEHLRQECDPNHMLFNYKPAPPRLNQEKAFCIA